MSSTSEQLSSQSTYRINDKVLTMATLNPHIANIEYAVRGPIVIRAAEIENELKKGVPKPFKQVIRANIGDCHACGQKPLTFIRQVVALCTYPDLMDNPHFNDDAKQRARRILDDCRGHSIGSYSDSIGIDVVRHDVARYISERDGGIPSNPDDIFLSTGASEGIKAVMKLLVTGRDSPIAGIMLPVPVYPLYTALLAEFNTYPILYYLNEEKNWSLDTEELERALNLAKPHCIPRALVVINPGNPTGQVLKEENIKKIIQFAKRNNIFLLADEVYQHNIYGKDSEFHSFKKVMKSMGGEYEKMELASFMSTSKGYMGECGYRGGYCELINIDPEVKYHLLKSLSAKLCPSVTGQAAMGVVVNPPRPGEPSYRQFISEKDHVLGELKEKAQLTSRLLNEIEGITCNEVEGAMYAFPRIWLPPKAIEAAKEKNMEPDSMYCTELLEATGICVVPGSGFGQKPGTYHFRMTILPSVQELQELLRLFAVFHESFMIKYQ
ncbi:hypothetical protein HELRODRAFT_185412 [Helobdella robusta]|uniref:alanine transaminase n=1 Tax=Helobdella robusta TaxID=6412 RepID=T1FMS3_HELRO|nr:hypothetical protein HELRODRAFT_185412 [Helobdella robusta]ESO08006.1 hypothetical protein HELRODRAFT_185412 [Helobdella robusta]